ncbi:MAG TPA: PepSY-associated TM helix domain-containing protein [Methylocella sp.]|nr:PepSY-associated TM helix domain-containing protein [Methylocella sp.]
MIRPFFVWLHRWTGLAMAGFLIFEGLTGSLLAFYSDLERLVSPQFYATPQPGVVPLDFATLAERAKVLVPQGQVTGVGLLEPDQAGISFIPRKDPATGTPYELGFVELYLDPWTGEELGRRVSFDISQGLVNLMPFIYVLHASLQLGPTGLWILGVVALLWTLDCFVGFYLTLPVVITAFWDRWRPAWQIKRRAGFFRLNFDLHRASGLWLWPMLFIFAWSSVMFNLPSVYEWMTRELLDYSTPMHGSMTMPALTHPEDQPPKLDWRAAQAVGERLMAEQISEHGFTTGRSLSFSFDPFQGTYTYAVRSSLDVDEVRGNVAIVFDGDDGALRHSESPTGERSGNTVSAWLSALHLANVFGLPYRIFVCMLGLVITILSVTGVYIWWMKRRARKFSKAHRGATPAVEIAAP